ncbi:MAG: sodium:proton antiporter NhaD [Chitinispirillaceae bacterium]|nr:sodium:proton antiporter NhaD [Chitinispirillaceae bacterium]
MNALIMILFIAGYCAIMFERAFKINKAGIALLTGVACWTAYIIYSPDKNEVVRQLIEHTGDFSGILFFLMGAMAIVELIDAHNGFSIITNAITTRNKIALLWLISLFTFFLSPVIDNLTTAIVMVSLVSKILLDRKDIMLFAAMIVIVANAGGVWAPIGNVTTTMLWIGERISSIKVITGLIVPSLVCAVVPLLIITVFLSRKKEGAVVPKHSPVPIANVAHRNLVFFTGIGVLLFVPVFKALTHLPPFMGVLLGFGVIWVLVEVLHKRGAGDIDTGYSVTQTLSRIDLSTILFFLGILISVSALQSSGILHNWAAGLEKTVKNYNVMVLIIGVISAVVDNVPLVAGVMGMYDLASFPLDHPFWIFLSYCAGTGGSLLVIGSAAGVVSMGLAKIDFFWYLKKISLLALAGYLSGAGVYLLIEMLTK